jgi:hypothetical protein
MPAPSLGGITAVPPPDEHPIASATKAIAITESIKRAILFFLQVLPRMGTPCISPARYVPFTSSHRKLLPIHIDDFYDEYDNT